MKSTEELSGEVAADMTYCAGLIEDGRPDVAARYLRSLAVCLVSGNWDCRPLFPGAAMKPDAAPGGDGGGT